MLEKVIKLKAPTLDEKETLLAPPAKPIKIKLVARAPEGRCELKLWNQFGRSPEVVEDPLDFRGPIDHEWALSKSAKELDGWTLTWWIRLASSARSTFDVQLQVLQSDGQPADASYRYSGPLEAHELEERDGRFHFKLEN